MQQLAQDKDNKQRVKQYGDVLGKELNMVKAFSQRQQEAAQKQNGNGHGMDPEALVKAQLDKAAGVQKLQHKQQSHVQKMQMKQQDFSAKQQQDKAKTLNQISLNTAKATAEARSKPPKSPFDEGAD
jgi:hypothetical protein